MLSNESKSISEIEFPTDIKLCHDLIRMLLEASQKSEKQIKNLQHYIEQLIKSKYGRKSERLEDIDPALLLPFMQEYLESLKAMQPEPVKVVKQDIAYTRNQPVRRNSFPANLERQQVIHDLEESEKVCSCCGEQMEKIGEDKSEQLDYVPAKLSVIVHVRYKYACKHKSCEGKVVRADKDRQPLEKSLAAAGLLAHVAVSKYVDHLPLNRIENIFKRHDIEISRSTMCDWTLNVAELLRPLYDLMKTEIIQSRVIKTDDTPVDVQDKAHEKGIRKGRIWIYVGDKSYPYYVYDYTSDRSSRGPGEFLREYRSGFIQADAYAGYDFIFNDKERCVRELLCWAHARRKFYDAQKTAQALSLTALAWIKQLYDIEREIKDKSTAERYKARQEKSVKLLADFKSWLDDITPAQALPQSPFRQAINYAQNGWEALERYTSDGDFDIDNNEAERQMRPVAIGRKNWLFFGSDRGGHAAAILMSIAQSAKRNGLNPYLYLRNVIENISDTKANNLKSLLPNQWHPR